MTKYNFVSTGAVLEALNRHVDVKKQCRLVKKCEIAYERVKPRERQSAFNGDVRLRLRKYVDEWLRTGRNDDGSESPLKRSLLKTNSAKVAANAYVQAHPFCVVLDQEMNISIEAPSEPSERVVSDNTVADLGNHSRQRTDFLFVAMLASEWKHQLYWCPRCTQYKVQKNAPRSRYKHGVYCRRCLQAATAERLTGERRQRRRRAQASVIAQTGHR